MRNTTRSIFQFMLLAAIAPMTSPLMAQYILPSQRTVVVSPVPENPVASGNALLAAVAAVSPSGTDRWLLKIEPGIYDIGTQPLQMKRRLDIEGSGQGVTTILGTGQESLSFSFKTGVIQGADNAELRKLRVQCQSTVERPGCITMANYEASPRLVDVTLVANSEIGNHWGIRNSAASPDLDRVTIVAANGFANYGVANGGPSRPTLRRSSLEVKGGSSYNVGIWNAGDAYPVLVEDTRIQAFGGRTSAGMLGPETGLVDFATIRRSQLIAGNAIQSFGIGAGFIRGLTIEHSKILAKGPNSQGVVPGSFTEITVSHSEIGGETVSLFADEVQVGLTWFRGAGSIDAFTSATCAGVYDETLTFYPSTCP
ncbi:MAG: hypothetical protein AAGD06_11270 [Acidobacteriota bacterium]